jgi:TonB family protein
MIKVLFSLTFLIVLNCIGQDIECSYAPSGDYTGTCESFYSNGKIRSQTDFVNGLRYGNHKEYYKDGQLAASAAFRKESYIGKCYRYSQSGIIVLKLDLDSTETGDFVHYSVNGKQILETGQFKKGYRNGKWSFYDNSGKLLKTEKYDADKTLDDIYGNQSSNNIIIPYDETIDKLYFDDYGMPFEVTPEIIIDTPDIDAEFPGGKVKLQEYINENVIYPTPALRDKQVGKVFLSFIVELDGSVTDIKVLRGAYPELDKEAKRLVEKMPNWIPGIYMEQKVRTRCYLPISFTL